MCNNRRLPSAPAGCERAGLGRNADIQMQVAFTSQGRINPPAHRDHGIALALEHRQQHQDFVALAGIGQRQQDVGVGDHAQVAVAGFTRMHVERRGAGGGQGRGDLARHVP